MVLTKTPFRISLFGGGSDLESYYGRSMGAVLSFTIDKYMYISSHNFFEPDKIRAKYSQTETVCRAEDLVHPIIREICKEFEVKGGLEVSSIADIPAGTGLGSSSSFTVGLLQNLLARKGQIVPKAKLAEMAADIEIHRLGEPIGKQDQYAAAFGGINIFRFRSSGHVDVEPVYLTPETFSGLQKHMLLLYTGQTRSTSEVLTEQNVNLESEEKFRILEKMVNFVEPGYELLRAADWRAFGSLLNESWQYKKQMASSVSNSEIDRAYDSALDAGAWGGKLLGAGGGGFLLFFCDPDKFEKVKAAVGMRQMPFKIELDGSKIIYLDEESLGNRA